MTKDKNKALKFIMKLFLIIFFTSCNNSQSCPNSSYKAFEIFKSNVQNKNFLEAKKLFSNNEFEEYIDTLFNILKKPTIEFIPEKEDGAFGIKKVNNAEMYYATIKEDNKEHSIVGIMFRKNSNCYQIVSINKIRRSKSKTKKTNLSVEPYKIKTENERIKIIGRLKEKAKRDWPNDYTTQEYWVNEQIKAYEYMLNIENNSIKRKAQRDWPLDYTTQKYWYNEQIEARGRLK